MRISRRSGDVASFNAGAASVAGSVVVVEPIDDARGDPGHWDGESRLSGVLDAARDLVAAVAAAIRAGEEVEPEEWLELRAQLGVAYHLFNRRAKDIDSTLGLTSARARLRAYLLLRQGEVVTNDELSGVAGIHEWARRLRELEVEEGWQITAGPGRGLRHGTYRLEVDQTDDEKAAHWRIRNSIRRRAGGAQDRLLALMQAMYPSTVSNEDLAYVAKINEWPRRMRELEEAGWDVISSVDDPSLPPGSYRLGSLDQGPARNREAIKQRAAILKRDDWMCRDCGASPHTVRGTILQVHHIHAVSRGGGNIDENLITLCQACHAGRHAIDRSSIDVVRDELLHPAADLGPEVFR